MYDVVSHYIEINRATLDKRGDCEPGSCCEIWCKGQVGWLDWEVHVLGNKNAFSLDLDAQQVAQRKIRRLGQIATCDTRLSDSDGTQAMVQECDCEGRRRSRGGNKRRQAAKTISGLGCRPQRHIIAISTSNSPQRSRAFYEPPKQLFRHHL